MFKNLKNLSFKNLKNLDKKSLVYLIIVILAFLVLLLVIYYFLIYYFGRTLKPVREEKPLEKPLPTEKTLEEVLKDLTPSSDKEIPSVTEEVIESLTVPKEKIPQE